VKLLFKMCGRVERNSLSSLESDAACPCGYDAEYTSNDNDVHVQKYDDDNNIVIIFNVVSIHKIIKIRKQRRRHGTLS